MFCERGCGIDRVGTVADHAIAEVRFDHVCAKTQQNEEFVEALVGDEVDQVRQERPAASVDHGLGPVARQRQEPGSAAASDDHRLAWPDGCGGEARSRRLAHGRRVA